MPTFIAANTQGFTDPICLAKEDEHHLLRVLRIKVGETFQITNNQGQIATLKVTATRPFEFVIASVRDAEPPSLITVCVPLIEQDRLEWAIEKLTELNIHSVCLITTERTQICELSPAKFTRLKKAAVTAQKQCGRATPLTIELPVALDTMDFKPDVVKVVASLASESSARDVLMSIAPTVWKCLIVGPEGGFSPVEEKRFAGDDFLQVGLGQTTLRSETAAVVLAVLVCYFS